MGSDHRVRVQTKCEVWVRITVLGKSPSWQDADGACSGYLIEEDGTSLLLDCGNGVFSKLRRFRDYVRSTRSSSRTCTPITSSTWSRTPTR